MNKLQAASNKRLTLKQQQDNIGYINNERYNMEKIAIELARLNATMAEILHLIQKEMKRGEELSKKYDKERNE